MSDTTARSANARSAKELKDAKVLFLVTPDSAAKPAKFLDEKIALVEMAKSPVGSELIESANGKDTKGGKVIYRKDEPKSAKKSAKPAPKQKADKPVKEPKEKPAKTGRREATFSDDAKITILAKENPKREGSSAYEKFKLYKKSATVADFLKAGGTRSCLAWDVAHEYISVK